MPPCGLYYYEYLVDFDANMNMAVIGQDQDRVGLEQMTAAMIMILAEQINFY